MTFTHENIARRELLRQLDREVELEILRAKLLQFALDKIYLKKEDENGRIQEGKG